MGLRTKSRSEMDEEKDGAIKGNWNLERIHIKIKVMLLQREI